MTYLSHSRFYTRLADHELAVTVHKTLVPPEKLCAFALRDNPNRALLVINLAAARHVAVKPSFSREIFTLLAAQIPNDLPQPTVFIGLAESAITLGYGVYSSYIQASESSADSLFISTSRHRLDCGVAVFFEEEHSHEKQEYLYEPINKADRQTFYGARSVVIVEDELTTGKTVANLVRSLAKKMPQLQCAVVANLTDWRAPDAKASFCANLSLPTSTVSLLEGALELTLGSQRVARMPKLQSSGAFKDQVISSSHGRRGVRRLALHDSIIEKAMMHAKGKCLVLATEEFGAPPFLLAEELERRGVDVLFQSTTRTPVLVGFGAIKQGMTFKTNYTGDDIVNFAYNVAPGLYDSILIGHETPEGSLDPYLIDSLSAVTIAF